jgi:hypothetical protein
MPRTSWATLKMNLLKAFGTTATTNNLELN